VALRPLSESRDVIRIVLIAYDPDDLAALELKAFTQYLDEEVGDIVPSARLGTELVGNQGAHSAQPPFLFAAMNLMK
jgi:hypothetical protein